MVASKLALGDTVVHSTRAALAPRQLGEEEGHLASRSWHQWMEREPRQVVVEGAHNENLVLA